MVNHADGLARKLRGLLAIAGIACALLGAGAVTSVAQAAAPAKKAAAKTAPLTGIHKIQHVVIIMQENRSFDEYFGTFPGADGLPMKDGDFAVCVPDPRAGTCVKPYHDTHDANGGGGHANKATVADIDGGKMDGFIDEAEHGGKGCGATANPVCQETSTPDVMGYHDQREIPNYWAYAKSFVLQDHMFEPAASWSLTSHLYEVSAWSAYCTKHDDPKSCTNELDAPGMPPDFNGRKSPEFGGAERNGPIGTEPIYAWTDMTYLLHEHRVTWGFYVFKNDPGDCDDDSECGDAKTGHTFGWWNPLPFFDTVKKDQEQANVQSIKNFYKQAKAGTLPSVSWVSPSMAASEHPPSLVSVGQSYVTSLINAVMQGPDWDSTVIFVSWDDWGGFYDHELPPTVDANGYGLRVPALVISPYVKPHLIDHQILSFDAYLKFIEDDFLGGARLDPKTDGRPDPRISVRENAAVLGNLVNDFDFNQKPLPPLVLPEHPTTDLVNNAVSEPARGKKKEK